MFFLQARGPAVSVDVTVVFMLHSLERFDSLRFMLSVKMLADAPNCFHSAILTALEFFEFFLLLLASTEWSAWEYHGIPAGLLAVTDFTAGDESI